MNCKCKWRGDQGCSSLGQTTDGRQGLPCRARGVRGEIGGWRADRWMDGGREREKKKKTWCRKTTGV